jgi:hypothetical protein
VTGLANSSCSGPCAAGYSCPAGSTNATATACPVGTYSNDGDVSCSPCPAGVFGATLAANVSACTGPCAAGYSCPAGSINATATPCPVGTYSLTGWGVCGACPPGRFGNTSTTTNASCMGPCAAGYACLAASTIATASLCPVGRTSGPGAAVCTLALPAANQPAFTFMSAAVVSGAKAVLAAQLDGNDSLLDVVVLASSSLRWLRNGGGAAPSWTVTASQVGTFSAFAVANIDGEDALPDVVATNSQRVAGSRVLWFKNGAWTQYAIRNTSGGSCDALALVECVKASLTALPCSPWWLLLPSHVCVPFFVSLRDTMQCG